MAKQTYTKEERKVQFLKTGIEIAKTKGIMEVSGASVAKKNKVTAPLVFHVFGSRDKLRKAVIDKLPQRDKAKAEAALAAKKPAPKRKRSVAEVKAIKNKVAATKKVTRSAKDGKFVTKAAAKKRPATTVTQTVKVTPPKPKKFATVTPPSVDLAANANPSNTL